MAQEASRIDTSSMTNTNPTKDNVYRLPEHVATNSTQTTDIPTVTGVGSEMHGNKELRRSNEHVKVVKTTDTTTTTGHAAIEEPSKMHAVKDKFIGGIKETIGTVAHAESLKESGREQKREGDAEALAAGKGDKHYDPALARKGVGIQHKHMGANPKKLTEGPCAGCKEGTCQVGHDYDAAICHSVTQGHADAGHVKAAGMGTEPKHMHGDGIATAGACCNAATVPSNNNNSAVAGEPAVVMRHPAGDCAAVPVGHNTAYDAAACPTCEKRAGAIPATVGNTHSEKDKELMHNMEEKKIQKEKEEIKKEEKKKD